MTPTDADLHRRLLDASQAARSPGIALLLAGCAHWLHVGDPTHLRLCADRAMALTRSATTEALVREVLERCGTLART